MKRSLLFKLIISSLLLLLVFYFYYFGKDNYNEYKAKEQFLMSIPMDLSVKPVTSEDTCRCKRQINSSHNQAQHQVSTCDDYSSLRGPGQKVVSFSFYGRKINQNDFFKGIYTNVERINVVYPGWITRVYHSVDTEDENALNLLCKLWCNFPTLDFCQVGKLPQPLNDQSNINGMIWRFFPLGDPLVERFVVRDLDSVVGIREKAAVTDWIKSNYTWHFMNDHIAHYSPILGGMWGGVNKNLEDNTKLRQQLINDGLKYSKGSDQELLTKYLKPMVEASQDYLNHNSHYCGVSLPVSVAWPVKRASEMDYVGRRTIINETVYIVYLTNVELNGVTIRLAEPSRPAGPLHLSCHCGSRLASFESLEDFITQSTCDQFATSRGENQKVISYSLTGKNVETALQNIEINANSISTWLPEWVIRVYHNINVSDTFAAQQLCTTWCKYQGVDFCQVSHLPPPLYDQTNTSSSVWKFLVLGDPLVERFMISDVNSLIGEADVYSIQRWIQSNESWSFMRYHPIYHTMPLLLVSYSGKIPCLVDVKGHQFLIPPRCQFLNSDIEDISELVKSAVRRLALGKSNDIWESNL
ncbi:hypothetical protein CHUAL_011983 [Chamberlinius hualienensis]